MKEALVRLIKELSAHLNLEELQNYHTSSGLETEEHFSKPFQKVAVDNISASTERERREQEKKRKKKEQGGSVFVYSAWCAEDCCAFR